MGYTTDFVGHIDIDPPLNEAECDYLLAFSRSRRWDRPEGPYAVPGNPSAEEPLPKDAARYNRKAPGQPQLWCQWVPCWDGCCLSFSGHEKFYEPIRWLEYLLDHFLRPGARAETSGEPAFEHFTFDHRLAGMIVGCRRDTRELFAIEVERNAVRTRVLRRGDSSYDAFGMLPYEEQIDRERADRRRRRRRGMPDEPGAVAGTVVPLVR